MIFRHQLSNFSGGQQVGHESALFPCGQEDQGYPGVL